MCFVVTLFSSTVLSVFGLEYIFQFRNISWIIFLIISLDIGPPALALPGILLYTYEKENTQSFAEMEKAGDLTASKNGFQLILLA